MVRADLPFQLRNIYLHGGYDVGVNAAGVLREEIKSFVRRERLARHEAVMVIYVYADLERLAADFYGATVEERVRNLLEFQRGFQEAAPHSVVLLVDLDVGNPMGKIYLESE